jgi:hypothetical protein
MKISRTRIFAALLICLIAFSMVVAIAFEHVFVVAPEITNKHMSITSSSVSNSTLASLGIVGASTTFSATVAPNQRKTFYACGLFWAFYSNGSGLAYATSSDGLTWTSSGTPLGYNYGDDYCLYFDGTYAQFAETEYTTENNVYYERALPCSNGSLMWGPGNQVVQNGIPGTLWYDLSITVDSSGRPWILYDDHMCQQGVYVTRSNTTDGTWTTDSGFPHLLMNPSIGEESGFLVPLTNDKVYMEWFANGPLEGVLYDGTAFGSTETITQYDANAGVYVSAVAQGDNVDLAFLVNGSYDILFTVRNSTSWSNPTLIQPGNATAEYSDSAPVLSIDPTTGSLYCFWAGNPASQHIYYKKCINGNWDRNATEWITEKSITYYRSLTCFYQSTTFIGLEYTITTSNVTSPYQIKFVFLNNNAPTILILSPESMTYNMTSVPLIFTVDQTTSWMGYSLDGQSNTTVSGNTTLIGLTSGVHYVVVFANNTASMMGASSITFFTIQTFAITNVSQNPTATIVTSTDVVSVNATVTDSVSTVTQVFLNYINGNGTWITANMTNLQGNIWNSTIPAFPNGTNITYIVAATDSTGNTVTTQQLGYTLQYTVVP